MVTRRTLSGSNSSTVKSHNLRAILLALLQQEHVSRVQLAKITGLSTTTITNLVTELLEQGIVVEEGTETLERRRGAGRPRMALRLVPEARYAVGVHIGVGSVRVAVTNLRANMLATRALAHPLDLSAQDVLTETAQLIEDAISQSNINPKDVIGVGVGASGLVDPDTGVNLMAPNLGWRDVMVEDWLSKRLQLPVSVDNNVRAMALGEALFGPVQNVRVLAFVYARIGVGAGFVVDGRLYWGSGAGAGEIGHTTIIPEGGALCRCGNTGCLETLVSEPAIMTLAQQLVKHDPQGILAAHLQKSAEPTIEQVFTAARAGDVPTQTMLNQRARYMGIALANLVNVLNPELILLGGIFTQGHDLLLPTVETTVRQRAFANLGERVRIQPTHFSHNAGMIGSAALALTAFFYQQYRIPTSSQLPEVIM